MNVLYADHTSLVSGAQRALVDLIDGLPPSVEPILMSPRGPLADMVRERGVPVVDFPGTSGSLRLHPWQSLKASAEIVRSALALRRAANELGADIIHANSIRAGLIAGLARPFGLPPVAVHIHDALPFTLSANVVRRVVRAGSDAIITISEYTTQNFTARRSRDAVYVLHNPLDLSRFDPDAMTKSEARVALGVDDDAKLIGLIAQITPWKGQDTAIRALALLHERHPEARLLLVGETKFVEKATRYDNLSFERWLHTLTRSLGLDESVEFWGEREDVATIMRAIDVLVAPSWEEPFGRSVIEAMALQTPVVATSVGGPAEYIVHGVDGLILPPRDVDQWAVALDRLLRDEDLREELAVSGSRKVRERFERGAYASKMVEVYHDVIGGPSGFAPGMHSVNGGGDLR